MISIKNATHAFFRWWADGLYQGLPNGFRKWLKVDYPRLILWPISDASTERQFEAAWMRDGKSQHLGQFDAHQAQSIHSLLPKKIRQLFERQSSRQPKFIIELQLPTKHVLSIKKDFPETLKANLDQSIGYQIDRITPFSADKVYFAAHVADHDRKKKQITAEVFASPKRYVDTILEQLKQGGVDQVHAMSVQGHSAAINLAPVEKRSVIEQSRFSKWPLYVFLAALCLSLILPVAYKQRRVDQIDLAISDFRKQAAEQLAIRDQLFAAEEALTFLDQKRQYSPMALDVVEKLSQQIPADTWLERLELRGQLLEIRGESDQALALIDVLEESEDFSDVRFNSPVSLNKRTKKDKFHIQATVEVDQNG